MQNPGRGRRTAVAFVLALVCAALAPAVAGADTITYEPRDSSRDLYAADMIGLTDELITRRLKIVITYDGTSHLTPGSKVTIQGTPPDADWRIEPTVIQIPDTWGSFGAQTRGEAALTYQTQVPAGQMFPDVAFTPTSYSCGSGVLDCLPTPPPQRYHVQILPRPVPSVSVDAGVTDAITTWEPSPDHAHISQYVYTRFSPTGGAFRQELVSRDPTSFRDTGLQPNTDYCVQIRGLYIGDRGDFSTTAVRQCFKTGQNPAPPSSGVHGPALDGDGQVDLTWDGSPEPGVRYDLQHRDENDGDWTDLKTGLTSTGHGPTEAEGTWRYRVRSTNDRRGASDFIETTSAVKIDLTAPSAPNATVTGERFGDWFKDKATVSFGGSSDPALADTSPGSGVVSEKGGATFDTTDTHTATGTATDAAGHTSSATEIVKVDASAPELAVSGCPTRRVLLGTDVRLSYGASDKGSGLTGDESGEERLDTSEVGTKSHTITARDHVDHATSKTCEYTVYRNSAPPTPAAPTVPAGDRADGTFGVTWGAVTDVDPEDTVQYATQRRDANDGDNWTDIPGRLDAVKLAAEVGEGTWEFRVKAIDSQNAESDWSAPSGTVKVDKSGPTAPAATADRPAEYGDDWFKDTITISFGGSTDPKLQDGSTGTGVDDDTYTEPKVLTASGSASGYAADRVGNPSNAGSLAVRIDATTPVANTESCPSNLIVGQPAEMAWSASDGGVSSGLKGASSGAVSLDTSKPGTYTEAGPAPEDNVGHEGVVPTCTYTVAYKFAGFLSPINGDAVNVGKTGRTYPIKWRLQRYDGSLISDIEAQALVPAMAASQRQVDCFSGVQETTALEDVATGDTALRYDTAADQFIYNYAAPQTLGCYVLGIRHADAANTKQVNFRFTK